MPHPTISYLTNVQAARLLRRSVATVWQTAGRGDFGPLKRTPGDRAARIAVAGIELLHGTFSPAAIEAAARHSAPRPQRSQKRRLYTPRQLTLALAQRDAEWRTWLADKRMQRAHPNGPPAQEGAISAQ